ncbi:MAG: hypothetical protein GX770_06065 [Firmicutes bacterium]|nr:hypothetical protein [Bacillota bacterium]
MPRVFLFGYYGYGNLGDELLCDYYVRLFRQYFPGLELVVLSASKQLSPENSSAPFTVASRWNFRRLGRMMSPGDLLVGGGGSIFQDVTSKRSLLYYLTLLRLARWRGVSIILTGQGIGPLSAWGRKAARPVLNLAGAIACRDQRSLLTLAAMEVNAPQLYLGVDPLWDYPLPPPRLAVAARGQRKPMIGYILRSGGSREQKHLLLTLRSLFANLQLITLSPADDEEAHKLVDELALGSPWCIRDPEEFCLLAPELTLVLSERLHGLLLAARCRIPGIGLGQDPKLHAFCRQMDWTCWGWRDPSLLMGVCTLIKKMIADPVSAYQKVQQQAKIMEQKGEEDRRWFINQVQTVLSGR